MLVPQSILQIWAIMNVMILLGRINEFYLITKVLSGVMGHNTYISFKLWYSFDVSFSHTLLFLHPSPQINVFTWTFQPKIARGTKIVVNTQAIKVKQKFKNEWVTKIRQTKIQEWIEWIEWILRYIIFSELSLNNWSNITMYNFIVCPNHLPLPHM